MRWELDELMLLAATVLFAIMLVLAAL